MLAIVHLCLIGILAYALQFRAELADYFCGLPRYLLALGLALFLVTWADYLAYVVSPNEATYLALSWLALLAAVCYFVRRDSAAGIWRERVLRDWAALIRPAGWNGWFLAMLCLVLVRFALGFFVAADGEVWANFNFIDTAAHLSIAQSFLGAPGFPPPDLNVTPFPLKYHFLADFQVAHLVRLGLPLLASAWWLNVLGAAAMTGALWAVIERWLDAPPRWVLLAAVIFFCLNPAPINLLHYLAFHPAFFNPRQFVTGVLLFPYFNFESVLNNLFEPQRGLVFALPVALLILHTAMGDGPFAGPAREANGPHPDALPALLLLCLLPLAHAVAFAVLASCLLPELWRQRRQLAPRLLPWTPLFVLGALQLCYLRFYGPPANPTYAAWDAGTAIPSGDFSMFPPGLRRAVFWFFTNGDFFGWAGLFFGVTLWRQLHSPTPPLGRLLRRWRWYFAVCGAFFLLINFYRYSPAWGDSNKFILFLNLGLALTIAKGATLTFGAAQRRRAAVLWGFLLALCVWPYVYEIVEAARSPMNMIFSAEECRAAKWLQQTTRRSDIVLTAAYNDVHFVSALAGRPTLAGINAQTDLYRQDARAELIRRFYEDGDFGVLPVLHARYVCLCRRERLRYKLNPVWRELMLRPGAVAFHDGGPDDFDSVYIFAASTLLSQQPAPPGRPAAP